MRRRASFASDAVTRVSNEDPCLARPILLTDHLQPHDFATSHRGARVLYRQKIELSLHRMERLSETGAGYKASYF